MNKLITAALLASVIISTALSGCADGSTPANAPTTVQTVYGANKLVGQWNGPEGTYLIVGGSNGRYAITIANLDGPRTFQGSASGDVIAFERDGKRESLRASDGALTGMKWLADKKDCVTVASGEGYCRD